MGWGNCGTDSQGRGIGYCHEGICDHPDCNEEIDRGLSYACGGMHGETEEGCEKYFCSKHLNHTVIGVDGNSVDICDDCFKILVESWVDEFILMWEDGGRKISDEEKEKLLRMCDTSYSTFKKYYDKEDTKRMLELLEEYLEIEYADDGKYDWLRG